MLLDPNDQTQLKESGKPITLTWTIALDGTNGDDTKDVSEAIDFTLPDFLGNTTYSKKREVNQEKNRIAPHLKKIYFKVPQEV